MLTDFERLLGLDTLTSPYARAAILVLLAFLLFIICRRVLLALLQRVTSKVSNIWVRSILHSRFLFRISWVLPLLAMTAGVRAIAEFTQTPRTIVEKTLLILLTIVLVRSFSALFHATQQNYAQLEIARNRPIKGLLQILSLLVYLGAGIAIFSIIFDQSPWLFFSSLGAATAVILLIFRDTILSFVAGVQLTANHLIRVGDWIEIPKFDANGEVIDIALNSIKVQNWDRTITVIPAHTFIEHSFKNWRGMLDSGGRRIKRAILIDINSIRFLDEADMRRLGALHVLHDYIDRKQAEVTQYNLQFQDAQSAINAKHLTNIGTLRAYLNAYLRQHPRIHQDMALMVRQLEPTAVGLPLEIYAFTNTTKWVEYEAILSDIFDHVYAILPLFDIRAFQEPTGSDFARFIKQTPA
ncbi:MAG: mechanosensitive ion channel family protein [Pseudomonadales bacterium]|jgi:miniconductance mechanosensitive channel|nr:mechanosensitive ion channel family protein [Pseudomonadales bacterium]